MTLFCLGITCFNQYSRVIVNYWLFFWLTISLSIIIIYAIKFFPQESEDHTFQCLGYKPTSCCGDKRDYVGNHRAHNFALSCRDARVDRLMLVPLCCCCFTLTQAWSRVLVCIISNRHRLLLLNVYIYKRIIITTIVISLLLVLQPF